MNSFFIYKMTAPLFSFILLCLFLCFHYSHTQYSDDLRGDYCRIRYPQRCCPGRDDTCSAPILGTVCYCDMFCNRTSNDDCCPDFWEVCAGVPRPRPSPSTVIKPSLACVHNGRYYVPNQSAQINCNRCNCKQINETSFKFICEPNVCLVRPELIDSINGGHYGWSASNYSFFWGQTLQEGIGKRLGTFKPERPTFLMYEIHVPENGPLPEQFDARHRWSKEVHPVRDQGDCAASWAFSTTAVASDRLAIESKGKVQSEFSPQHLLSCQRRGQEGCNGGHLDKAWYYMRKTGITSESCFPYTSGDSGVIPNCPFKRRRSILRGNCVDGADAVIYQATPPYRVKPDEEEIMREIYFNGPVQATFLVNEDFFVYRSGVYRHAKSITEGYPETYRAKGYHSVRIIGWGVDYGTGRPIKYWLCANSWGTQWGENGLFRILRGEDECNIEMFIVGVWAKINPSKNTITL